jgi:hypothetical protein
MSTYQARLDAERELEARRLGMSLWQYDAARAVDDQQLRDLAADARRSSPVCFPSTVSTEVTRPLSPEEQKWEGDLTEVLACAGIYRGKASADVVRFAGQCIVGAKGDMGQAKLMFCKKARQNGW